VRQADDAPFVAVVAAHGDLAAGLVSAVEQITGRGGLLRPFTNRGLCGAEVEGALRAVVDAGATRAIFTDLPGGSCTMAARRLQRERPELVVATGVNLAALLDFVCGVDHATAADCGPPADAPTSVEATRALVARAVERGRGALAAATPPAPAVPAPAAANGA
jgi:PTS system N-acetylgalactosamine-specific IIA component